MTCRGRKSWSQSWGKKQLYEKGNYEKLFFPRSLKKNPGLYVQQTHRPRLYSNSNLPLSHTEKAKRGQNSLRRAFNIYNVKDGFVSFTKTLTEGTVSVFFPHSVLFLQGQDQPVTFLLLLYRIFTD